MLSINFTDLRDRYPHLRNAYDAVERWLADHPKIRHIEPVRILRKNKGLDLWELDIALGVLVDEGVLQRSIGVLSPSKTLAQQFFASPREIPTVLYDSSDDPFNKDDGELLTVYQEATR